LTHRLAARPFAGRLGDQAAAVVDVSRKGDDVFRHFPNNIFETISAAN
jgi:hypothetical protein